MFGYGLGVYWIDHLCHRTTNYNNGEAVTFSQQKSDNLKNKKM